MIRIKLVVIGVIIFILNFSLIYFLASNINTLDNYKISPYWFLIIFGIPSFLALVFPSVRKNIENYNIVKLINSFLKK